ncbi:hypothetical protein BXY57_0911 [Thermoflavifilum aggregans]|uniref:Uncharacterized protein n=1 Tax=Thermoflavifilum aggregans TaxID=454188 RepID=A0A2M9CTT9_9BACT|nr:hypothetical protein BXY57_0911 [Thermoflavifilum aggregans]
MLLLQLKNLSCILYALHHMIHNIIKDVFYGMKNKSNKNPCGQHDYANDDGEPYQIRYVLFDLIFWKSNRDISKQSD